MGIAQRLTVVKQHDTEPARSPPGRFTPNARSHGLPDAPQALRWGGVPAAKHPRKIAHHGPEPNFCTPFPTDGQVFSMQNPGRHASAQAAPSSARQCREACPHLPPLRAGRAPTPLVPARAPWSEHICRMHPERPVPAIRRPASSAGPATRGARNRTLHRPRRPWSFYHNQNGGHLPHSAASRPPPPFFGRDFTRLQARHTATGDARRMRPHGWWPRPAHHDATRSRTRSPRAPFQHGRNGPRQPPAPSFPRPAPHASRI